MAAPGKQVINVMGDAAFGTVGLDIETAVRSEIPILTIILNNSTMAIYPDSRFPYSVEKYNITGLSGKFSEVAQALGAYAEKVVDPIDIIPAIQRGLDVTQTGRPAVLEFITKEEGEYSKFQFR